MEGARIIRVEARRPDLRQPLPRDFAKRLEGQTVTGIGRRAKYLTADLASGDVLLMHIVPRRDLASHPLMREVGPEPLGNAFDANLLAAACRNKKTSLKAALLDQTVVAGLGNIYVCEALHRARLSPKRNASTIATRTGAPNAKALALVDAIKAVLNEAIKAGGSSLRDHRQTDGELGYFQHHFRVYDREGEPCVTPACRGKVKRIVQNGRSTFFCPVCQR